MTIRRMKTYTSQTGYVYQYYFVGKRTALPGITEVPATEYVFDVSSDRESYYAISIFLLADALAYWAGAHGRELSEAEQYAAAKLRLLAAFDEVEGLRDSSRQFAVAAHDIETLLEVLDLG